MIKQYILTFLEKIISSNYSEAEKKFFRRALFVIVFVLFISIIFEVGRILTSLFSTNRITETQAGFIGAIIIVSAFVVFIGLFYLLGKILSFIFITTPKAIVQSILLPVFRAMSSLSKKILDYIYFWKSVNFIEKLFIENLVQLIHPVLEPGILFDEFPQKFIYENDEFKTIAHLRNVEKRRMVISLIVYVPISLVLVMGWFYFGTSVLLRISELLGVSQDSWIVFLLLLLIVLYPLLILVIGFYKPIISRQNALGEEFVKIRQEEYEKERIESLIESTETKIREISNQLQSVQKQHDLKLTKDKALDREINRKEQLIREGVQMFAAKNPLELFKQLETSFSKEENDEEKIKFEWSLQKIFRDLVVAFFWMIIGSIITYIFKIP